MERGGARHAGDSSVAGGAGVGVLTTEADEAGPAGWQAWPEPALGAPCLWAASFAASVPQDLVAAFAASLSSTAPVLRRVLPEATQERLLRAPVI
ncbi:DUF317 domain-containing protein [Streptomyces sp. NBC_00154]|nr:DUF317 domain-containing protein [Streptomyces sp. NBC_00154]